MKPFQRPAKYGTLVALLAGILVWQAQWPQFPARADGFHLPNFYEPTVLESWAKMKQQFKFPELPKGKTWSDGFPLGHADKRIRSHKTVRKGTPILTVLKSAIKKMIAVYKYTDPYNFAYDSPPWMRTLAEREQSIKDAQRVLKEIGYGTVPYLWEELEQAIHFKHHPRIKGIELYRDAQEAHSLAKENLYDSMRLKDPKFQEIEDQLEKDTVAFWKLDSLISSSAGKLNAKYGRQLFELRKMIRSYEQKDPQIKKAAEAEREARRKMKQALGKCPGDYGSYQGEFRISDDFMKRLRETMVLFGEPAKIFLMKKLAHRSRPVRDEAKRLLDIIETKLKNGAEPKKEKETPRNIPKKDASVKK